MLILKNYDLIVINSSGGKDSQTLLDVVYKQCKDAGVDMEKVIVVHADLGRAEWPGTRELAQRQAEHYGLEFVVVSRPQGDLVDRIRQRGLWPSPAQRYCTSDLKRSQIAKVIRGRVKQGTVLNCMGLRAEESPARAKKEPQKINTILTTRQRLVIDWLPLHAWTEADVWLNIKATGVPYHRAYDLGMPRLSCVFCIFAPTAALVLAGKHNPDLLDMYCDMEDEMQHSFKSKLSMKDIRALVQQSGGEQVKLDGNWNM